MVRALDHTAASLYFETTAAGHYRHWSSVTQRQKGVQLLLWA